ncbi:MAG TPA: sulfur oxidation c-type cytochrome SoxX [Caldimonas sp.]|jgi:sulfur-oxidizing protein SoxX|nr:sulfur oxidation c-type cytochrome SoxX [Caldimonas sp.]HEX2540331.1 sulfur oxidation c-type cytochrome SoxX [Caldimonas sp.]
MRPAIALVALAWLAAPACAQPQANDAASRGAAIVASRSTGLCVLCHAVPGVDAVHAGTLGPSLAGVGTRLGPEELRLRLVAPRRFNPETIMPSYGPTEGLERVAAARRGQPILDARQIDDVVAYLATLR